MSRPNLHLRILSRTRLARIWSFGLRTVSCSTSSKSDPSITSTHSSSQDLELPEDGRTLTALLQLCYPMADPEADDRLAQSLRDICLLYEAAKKYEIARAAEFAKRCCMADLDWSPVRVYLIAARFDWEGVMREAAWRCVHEHIERHVPEMATATTATYRRLLVYRQRCRDVIVTAVFKAAETQHDFDDRLPTYWCMEAPWLDGSGEMRFWKAIHAQVWDRAEDAERFPPIEDQAILPRSVVAAYNALNPDRRTAEDSVLLCTRMVTDIAIPLAKVQL